MNARTDINLKVAKLVWEGMPEEPIEFAEPCPHCGELPGWEKGKTFNHRWRLNCCDINKYGNCFKVGSNNKIEEEIKAVIDWNEAVESERDAMQWEEKERARKRRQDEDDAWVDAHLPMLA